MWREWTFWLLLAGVAYTYAGYPTLLWLASQVRRGGRSRVAERPHVRDLPRVSIVVPSSDRPEVLAQRLANLRALDYPQDRIDIIVGLDGAADEAHLEPDWMSDSAIHVVRSRERVGKTALLNQLVGRSASEIVVFTDANAEFEPEALAWLVAPLADPRVGCVTGELVYSNRHEPVVRAGEGLYWRLENSIKAAESRFGGTLVATGAIYAMRRALVSPLAPHISDDSANPLITLAAGYEVVVESRARAVERAATKLEEEFDRKARMVTRQLGAHARVRFFLAPLRPVLALRLASHKWLRWAVPFMLIGALGVNLTLLDRPFYRWTLLAAAVGTLAYLAGQAASRRSVRVPAALRLWVYFCTVNAAACMGVIGFLMGRPRVVWKISPTTRTDGT